MSYWKALAEVRDTPDAELRERLTEALYRLQEAQNAFVDGMPSESFEESVRELQQERDEACKARDEAEERLEEKLSEDTHELIRTLTEERDEALARLAKVEPLIEAYSDTLSFARRFVSLAADAGVKSSKPKTRHVRAVKTQAK